MQLKRGDVFCHIHPGGGGWGDPLERDPAAVLKDVRNEFVSAAKAEMDYGVVIDTKAWVVDVAATGRLREDMRRRRAWNEVPKVQWHDPDLPRSTAE
jgi:N-methylhydantoinase B